MKNIENKTIKELIPEGYEINSEIKIGQVQDNIVIPIKKKEKSREDYIKGYRIKIGISSCINPIEWHIEYKFGLIRYICNDLGYDFTGFISLLSDINSNKYDSNNEIYITKKILSILGEDFLQSIKDGF